MKQYFAHSITKVIHNRNQKLWLSPRKRKKINGKICRLQSCMMKKIYIIKDFKGMPRKKNEFR